MKQLSIIALAVIALACACKKDDRKPDATYNPVIEPANFTASAVFTNPYFPYQVGKVHVYEGQTDEGFEHIEYQVTSATKVVNGITCAVINDKVWVDSVLVEDTDDWYAQDNDGNVWYFGEAVDNYEGGVLTDHDGSWEAGVDGAKPGIIMLANPQVGNAYRQEYYFNEAEDEAEVLETGLTLTVPFGTFDNCIKTKDITDLEPDVLEHKFYAPGIGIVKELKPATGEELVLVDIQE